MSLPSSEGSKPTCDLLENQNQVSDEMADASIHNGDPYSPVSSTQMEELIKEVKSLREDQQKSGKWNSLVSYTMLMVACVAFITSLANLSVQASSSPEANLAWTIVYVFTTIVFILILWVTLLEYSQEIAVDSQKKPIRWIVISGVLSLGMALLIPVIVIPLMITLNIKTDLLWIQYLMMVTYLVIYIYMRWWLWKNGKKIDDTPSDSNTP